MYLPGAPASDEGQKNRDTGVHVEKGAKKHKLGEKNRIWGQWGGFGGTEGKGAKGSEKVARASLRQHIPGRKIQVLFGMWLKNHLN